MAAGADFDRIHRGYDAGMRLGAFARDRQLVAALAGARLVIDIGGGTGRLARRLAGAGAAVVVVEPSAGMLRHRREFAAVRGDGRRLPLADACAEAVAITDVLHHVPGHRALLGEARRVLRPGGRLAVLDFDARRSAVRCFRLCERLMFGHCRYLTPRELAADLAAAGFTGIRLRRLGWQVLATARTP